MPRKSPASRSFKAKFDCWQWLLYAPGKFLSYVPAGGPPDLEKIKAVMARHWLGPAPPLVVGALGSVENGRQERAARFVVKSQAHQGQWLGHAQTLVQAPAENLTIAARQQKTRAGKFRCGGNHRFQSVVVLRHGMGEKSDPRRITGDLPVALCYDRGLLLDRAGQFILPVVPVNFPAQ